MQQLFFIGPGRVEWRDIAPPTLSGAADALVRPLAVATCDIDTGLLQGWVPFPGPFPLGHEGIGEVIDVGSGVTAVAVGERVIIPFQLSCGTCGRCARGRTASCARVPLGAMYGLEPFGGPWGGFLSDVVRVPWADHMLVPLPRDIDAVTVASLSDNVCDGWRTVAPFVTDAANTSLLVIGSQAPSIPFYSIAVARALGVAQIDYLDFDGDAARAEKASRGGANVIEEAGAVRTGSYTLTVCSASSVDALNLALRASEPGGTCAVNAVFFRDDVPLPMLSMYTRGVHLVTGRVDARAALPHVLDLVSSGLLRPHAVTDAVVDWNDAAEALEGEPKKLVFKR